MTFKTKKMFSTQWEPKTMLQHCWFTTKFVGVLVAVATITKLTFLIWVA